jgi:tetratricopeptide (TPR) repeat protein
MEEIVKPLSSKNGASKKIINSKNELEKGDLALRSGDLKLAQAIFAKACQGAFSPEDPRSLGVALQRSARVQDLMGLYSEAASSYHESLKLFLQAGDKTEIARTKALLGGVGWATGDYSEAGRLLAEALFLFEETKDLENQAWAHDLVGNLKLAMRDDQEAERAYQKSHELMARLGANVEIQAWEFYHRGTVELFREHFSQARSYFEEAIKTFQKSQDVLGQVVAGIHLGEIACSEKDLSIAQERFRQAIQQVLPTGCKPLLMDALVGVSQLLKEQKQERKAIGILMVALSHPTCRQQTKDRMVSLVIHLESRFTSQEVKGGFQWAKEVSIEEMARSWVDSLGTENKAPKKK